VISRLGHVVALSEYADISVDRQSQQFLRHYQILMSEISGTNIRSIVMRRLTTGIRSEKCVIRRFRRRPIVIECTYTNVDSIAYYTPRLHGIACCS
jgi:hypothetical protein